MSSLLFLDKVKPAQSHEDNSAAAPSEPEPTKRTSSTSSGRRGRFNKEKNEVPAEEPSSTSAPARTGRRFNGRRQFQ